MNFWKDLAKPFFVLAPMEDVTDTVFRRIVKSCGEPDVYYTEFTSTDGFLSEGVNSVKHRLDYTEEERPIVAQIWGLNPEKYYKTAKILAEKNFDGIDINMGCPVHKIVKNGACSALIDNPSLAVELIQATKEGAPNLPLSVKTRLGFKSDKTESWSETLLSQNIEVLIMHGRLAKDMSKKPADWNAIKKVVEIKNFINTQIIVIGNGDVKSRKDGIEKAKETGVDGLMIGRGVFDNLYVFNKENLEFKNFSKEEKLKLMLKHVSLHREVWGERKPYRVLKKFFKIYASGFKGASELRDKLVHTENQDEVIDILNHF